jgi:protocatechuate 3,4-dioxygenase beta subunit|tara:strand:+ start:4002 stop:4631 length:630 start_codon:yes stop_codon:yes gene_type:complete
MKRRIFVKAGALGTVGAISLAAIADNSQPTPAEIKGPFYPLIAQKDKDFDLTKVNGSKMAALGPHIFVYGSVYDSDGQPIENAIVDVWQANAAGKYRHPHDSSLVPVDENFQGWAIVQTGKDGKFKFKTVLPGSYPVGQGWVRPPHIHFKVTKREYVELITQMYFPGDALNKIDKLLQKKNKDQQKLMIAQKSSDQPNTFYYRVVLDKA